jgi:hypothetical protein
LTAAHHTGIADGIGGLVAAEGTFAVAQTPNARGDTRPSFTFAVALAAVDRETCELLHAYFGVGRIRTYDRRAAHFDDECVFAVRAFADLVEVIVPFMDEHLPPSHKRTQYLAWREQLLAYESLRRGRRAR